ncbi:uncharacterized protein CLUP02_03307 [Colletotrichum lupini]|uniref:Uncharacterized protein n=1 Tax=Colletotrichum lupini TaxID=145971 RepID=A0A9Q8SI93_9PEZI|nr:uncharacterized protein CLUP02_03307 [Colletotrichum lupini]UQC77836.1 hypothetical protein CLUP02_03307 [Colletotrichum lupini]
MRGLSDKAVPPSRPYKEEVSPILPSNAPDNFTKMLLPSSTSLLFLFLAFTAAATSQSTPTPSPSQPPIDDGTVCPGSTIPCWEGCMPPDGVCCHGSSKTWWCQKGDTCGKREAAGCFHPPKRASSSSSSSSSAPTTSDDSLATATESVTRPSLTAAATTTTTGTRLPTCVFQIPPIVQRQQREKVTTTVSACPTELTSATSVPGAARGSGPAAMGQSWAVLTSIGVAVGFVMMLV